MHAQVAVGWTFLSVFCDGQPGRPDVSHLVLVCYRPGPARPKQFNIKTLFRRLTQQMLRHLMDAKGVTQAQLSREAAIPKSTISEMLAGKKPFSRQLIRKLRGLFQRGRQRAGCELLRR